jgi:hypothetical protein
MVIYWAKNANIIVGVDKIFDKETNWNLSINILKFHSINAHSVGKPSQKFTIKNYKPLFAIVYFSFLESLILLYFPNI